MFRKLLSTTAIALPLSRIDAEGRYHSPNIAFADTPATAWSDTMNKLVNNQGGQIEDLPRAVLAGGTSKRQYSRITLASQLSGTVIHVGRIPRGSVIHDIEVMTTISLGSTTIGFGDAHDTNSVIYGAAAVLTATNTMTRFGPPVATCGVEIATCYDYAGNGPLTPLLPSPYGGGEFEDINLITGAATAPASGTLLIRISYSPPA